MVAILSVVLIAQLKKLVDYAPTLTLDLGPGGGGLPLSPRGHIKVRTSYLLVQYTRRGDAFKGNFLINLLLIAIPL